MFSRCSVGIWGFARHHDQLAPFLDADVCCALDEVGRQPGSDRRQRTHRAWANHHGIRWVGAGGNRREPLFAAKHAQLAGTGIVKIGEKRFGVCRAAGQDDAGIRAKFLCGYDLRSLGVDHLHIVTGFDQAFDQAQAVGATRMRQ